MQCCNILLADTILYAIKYLLLDMGDCPENVELDLEGEPTVPQETKPSREDAIGSDTLLQY